MDYEKLYKEALERARTLLTNEVAADIFPELKESENERIRKGIIRCVKGNMPDNDFRKEYLAWLEKQVEQKSADKVEPKFHNGEWVVNTVGDTNKVVKVWDDGYTLDDNTFLSNSWATEHYHLWTIQDVKDGDVLCYKDEISIYKHNIENCTKQGKTFGGFVYHCCYDGKRFIINSLYSLTEQDKINIHPATKEQRDLLFQKMRKAGYEWDAGKLELRKVEQKQKIQPKFKIGDIIRFKGNETLKGEAETHKIVSYDNELYVFADGTTDLFYEKDLYELVEQKPAWSEEDERIVQNLLSLWKEVMMEPTCCRFGLRKDEVVDFLKSLKGRIQPQPKQEWSEADEKDIQECAEYLKRYAVQYVQGGNSKQYVLDLADRIESLRPQSTWRPSEEMLEALYRAIPENVIAMSEDEMLLDKLYQGLKYGRVLSKN